MQMHHSNWKDDVDCNSECQYSVRCSNVKVVLCILNESLKFRLSMEVMDEESTGIEAGAPRVRRSLFSERWQLAYCSMKLHGLQCVCHRHAMMACALGPWLLKQRRNQTKGRLIRKENAQIRCG